MFLPMRVEKAVNALEHATEYNGVYSGCIFYRNGKIYKKDRRAKTGNFLKETLSTTFKFHSGSNIFMRKIVFESLIGFDTSFKRHQDYEFLVRYFMQGNQLLGINECLLIKNNDNTNLPSINVMIEIKNQFLEKYSNQISTFNHKDHNRILFDNIYQLIEMDIVQRKYFANKSVYLKLLKLDIIMFVACLPRIIYKLITTRFRR
jgi:hypothetical protein